MGHASSVPLPSTDEDTGGKDVDVVGIDHQRRNMNMKTSSHMMRHSSIAAATVLLLITGAVSTTLAEEVSAEVSLEDTAQPEKSKDEWKAPWRGTSLTYRNVATAISLNKDAELGYNPYYGMAFTIAPKWWIGDVFNASLALTLMRELTHSDYTTNEGETELSDFTLGLGASNFVTIPVLEIGISASLKFVAPTSKFSRAKTMIMAVKPGLALSRNFDVLSGINLNYAFGFTKTFHEYTTSQNVEPSITYGVSTGDYGSYQNTGVRNVSWGLANTFGLGIQFVEWLGISGSVTLLHSFLYDQDDADAGYDDAIGEYIDSSSGVGGTDEKVRYVMAYNVEISVNPIPALGIGIGAETANNQLAPDSTYQKPFFNRYTSIYLDLRLNFEGLVSQLTSGEE